MLTWISESERLPGIAQRVLLATPRQHEEFWDIRTAQILVQHEGVFPRSVPAGSEWPTDYWWAPSYGRSMLDAPVLVTGNNWWAAMDSIPLPPGAEHKTIRGYHCVIQPTPVWVGKRT